MSRIKLFCFPYAGGSAAYYGSWKPFLKQGIELIPIELAGRGRRMGEPLYEDLEQMINDVYVRIKNQIKDCQYAFFGHSMGSMIAFELTRKIQENHENMPVSLFLSGRRAPHLPGRPKHYHKMDIGEFKNALMNLGGTPPEFFESPELVDIFLPVIRNDFRLAESPLMIEQIKSFPCRLTVFIGKEEDITEEEAVGWRHFTDEDCRIHYFNGGHFFLHEKKMEVIEQINQMLIQKPKQVSYA